MKVFNFGEIEINVLVSFDPFYDRRVCWRCSRFNYHDPSLSFEACEEALRKVRELNSRCLGDIMNTLAHLSNRDRLVLAQLSEEELRKVARFTSQDIPNTLCVWATLGYLDSALVRKTMVSLVSDFTSALQRLKFRK